MKKWQEIEFLDFKERQIRRRTQKTRAIQLEIERDAPAAGGLKIVAFTAVFLVATGVGGFTYWRHREEARALEVARRVEMAVSEVKGEVEFSTATTPFAPLKARKISETFTVRQAPRARTSITTTLDGRGLMVLDKATVEIQRPQVHDGEPLDRLYVTALLKQGTLMCEFKKGDPRLEVKLPMGVSVRAATGLFKVVLKDNGIAEVVVREGMVKIVRADNSKDARVRVDERAEISAAGDWAKPASFSTPETVWR